MTRENLVWCSTAYQPCDNGDGSGQCGSCEWAKGYAISFITDLGGTDITLIDHEAWLEAQYVARNGKPAGSFNITRGNIGTPDASFPFEPLSFT